MTPADELRQAVFLLRNPIRRPELCAVTDLPFTNELIDWLEHAITAADRLHGLFGDSESPAEFIEPQALALARAINGTPPATP